MIPSPTEDEVRAKAEAKGLALTPVPGSPGKYSVTQPPETTPLNDNPLTLTGALEWLAHYGG